jgi:hypothetical protein
MKNPILRFGIYSSIILLAFGAIQWVLWNPDMDYRTAEVIGYLSMIIALAFIFPGVRAYREEVGGGVISFGKALKVGSLIALLPSAAFFVYTVIFFYLERDNWGQYALEGMSEAQRLQFEANRELFLNPFFQGAVMFFTVFFIGFVIALISALVLRSKASYQKG